MPPSAWEQVAKDLLNHLQTARVDLEQLQRSIADELTENSSARAVLQEKVDQLGGYITDLDKVLRGGDGHEALTTQVTRLETEVKALKKQVEKCKATNGQPMWKQILVQSSPLWIGLILAGVLIASVQVATMAMKTAALTYLPDEF